MTIVSVEVQVEQSSEPDDSPESLLDEATHSVRHALAIGRDALHARGWKIIDVHGIEVL